VPSWSASRAGPEAGNGLEEAYMPQLAKGGKWVFAWVMVGPERELPVPAEAWSEYGFAVGEEALFLRGSRTSGGFGLTTPRLLTGSALLLESRAVARGHIDAERRLRLPEKVGVTAGDRLLVVRGSGRALGFLSRGPIWEEALRHPDLVCEVG